MSRKLEELFNLDSSESEQETVKEHNDIVPSELLTPETLQTVEKVEAALPRVRDLEASDKEMDELGDLAKEAFNNLMDLGMQVDSRFSAEIFNSASSMLGHALTAKTAKINKKLKMIDLQLKQAELERKIAIAKKDEPQEKTSLGTGTVLDRNELLRMIMNKSAADSAEKDK